MIESKYSLESQGLFKKYANREVVKNVSLKVYRGEIVGLLGSNGAGKTTTFYMMAGLIKADQGKVLLLGRDITSDPIHTRAHKGIGYLPQEASIFRYLSVEENIYLVLENRNIPVTEKRNTLNSLLNSFGLEKIRKSKGATLSGGERRRVEIARTLALSPRFILLDEPFAGIDPLAVNDIQEIIKELKNRNIGVLITDHSVRETLDIVDRAYIMNDGCVLIGGTPEDIIKNEHAKKLYLGEKFKM